MSLLPEGYVSNMAVAAGIAVRTGARHPMLDAYQGYLLENKPVETPKAPPPICTVNGVEVSELAVIIKPVAFLVTTENGTHEIGRCWFQKGVFTVGPDLRRIGGIGIESVEYNPELGLAMHLEKGYELFIPSSHCSATWRRLQ